MVSSTGSGTYLGREEQLDRLLARLQEAAAGRGGWLMVIGAPGMGVTSTIDELAVHAAQLGFGVLRGSSRQGIAGRPFGALAVAVEGAAEGADAVALYEALGDAAPALARLAPGLRVVLPATPPPAPLRPPDETLRIWDGYMAWLERATATQPLLLALDDMQWADDDTWALLGHVADRLDRHRLILATGWSTIGGPIGRRLPDGMQMVELPGLDEGALAALLARASTGHVSRAVARLVAQATGGHPLASLQLHRHLLEERLVGRPGGDTLPGVEELPTTVDETVAWRLARLSLDERTALGALACFPLAVGAVSVAAVSGLPRPRAAQALEGTAAKGFARSPEGSGTYEIEHPQVAAAIRASLSSTVRAEAYARVAESLEVELGTESRRHAPTLAELYRMAASETSTRAVINRSRASAGARYALVASEQARAASAYGRAAECLRVALDLAVIAEQAGQQDLRVRLAQAEAEAGRVEAAVATATQALDDELDRSVIDTLLASVRALLEVGADGEARQLREAIARRARPDRLLEARLALLAGAWQPIDAGAVHMLIWHTGEDDMELLLSRSHEDELSLLMAPQRARDHEQTVALLGAARDWRQPSALLRALHGASVDLATRLGRFREAASWAAEYLAAAERFGSPHDHVRALLLLAQCRAALGDFNDAREALASAHDLRSRLPADEGLADAALLSDLALAHYLDGDWPALAGRAVEAAGRSSPAGLLLAAESAAALVRAGDTGAAEPLVADVLEACSDWPPLTYLRDSALMSASGVAWECGWAQHAPAGRSLSRAAEAAGVGGNHVATPSLAMARMHALAGELAEAHALFAAQRDALAEAGRRPLRAMVDYDEAIALAAAGTSRRSEAGHLLELAARAFDELGMSGWLGRARRLLDDGFEAAVQPGGRLHFTYPRGLSRREADLVRLVSGGASLEQAAGALDLDETVARRHLDAALDKLGAGSPAELPRLARRLGLGGGV